ncbi:MAG: BA14K family protein [Phenylobacterium sp.]|uniref:BA14K family protein n=1 Tax=Phenylobacterium sp. TaxID=1871053 RepID=UPI002733ABCE|nr:BA14K family protein [Phenylobacterium sp.]MDP3748818.1 BA14K family protein [Phenylobacterium sp.]
MRKLTTFLMATSLAAGAATSALAYPTGVQPALARPGDAQLLQVQYGRCFAGERPSDCRERVRWERRYRDRYEWRDGRYHPHGDDPGAALAATILGFALGAAIRGSQDDYDYYVAHRDDRYWRERCRTRYRSFDLRTGTYIETTGYRRYCRL